MEDPFWKDNEYRALDLMEKDYEYETAFEGTEAQEGERQWLRFEGLDTICDIYLNEEKIGNTYNMHRTWELDVTGKVKAGENILRVYFHSPLEYGWLCAYPQSTLHVRMGLGCSSAGCGNLSSSISADDDRRQNRQRVYPSGTRRGKSNPAF